MSTAEVSAARRWRADPLTALGVVAAVTALVAPLTLLGWGAPFVLVLLGVVAAGLSLSGST